MLIVATYQNRIIAHQILPKNQNVNHDVYEAFLEQYLLPEVSDSAFDHLLLYMIMQGHISTKILRLSLIDIDGQS